MELDKETIASCRRFLNSKAGKNMIEHIDSKRPYASKADLEDLTTAAMCASRTTGFTDCEYIIKEIKTNPKYGEL